MSAVVPSSHPRTQSAGIATISVGDARQRAMQAVHYYTSSVLQPGAGGSAASAAGAAPGSSPGPQQSTQGAGPPSVTASRTRRMARANGGFGPSAVRASYNERLASRLPPSYSSALTRLHLPDLHRSNSSLELEQDGANGLTRAEPAATPTTPGTMAIASRRREYGSHGSIDAVGASPSAGSSAGDSFFAMLRDYRPVAPDQRSPGPARIAEVLRGKLDPVPASENAANALTNGALVDSGLGGTTCGGSGDIPSSPKLRIKLQKFWEKGGSGGGNSSSGSGGNGGNSGSGSAAKNAGKHAQQQQSQPESSSSSSSSSIFKKLRGAASGSSRQAEDSSGGNAGSGGGSAGNNGGSSSANNSGGGGSGAGSGGGGDPSSGPGDNGVGVPTEAACRATPEERVRRRVFGHYDCQSVAANIAYVATRRGLLAKRRNTATGASAASMVLARSNTPDDGTSSNSGPNSAPADCSIEDDFGDGRRNDLVESCPFFRNEIGGEVERVVSLTRTTGGQRYRPGALAPAPGGGDDGGRSGGARGGRSGAPLHRPALAAGVSVLEASPGETLWRQGACPYQRHSRRALECVDNGALYYRKYFYGQEHYNWFGIDENLGPVAISLRREKQEPDNSNSSDNSHQYLYRLIVRTSELLTLRGSVLEDAIPSLKSSSSKGINTKEVLEYVTPEIQLSCLRLGVQSPQTEEQLLKLDQQGLTTHYKVGIMYCRAGQSTEEEMYNNEEAGPAFNEFLETIGQRVRLKGFDKYKAGLDNKTDSTGLYSVYAQYQDCEIMFHVSTLLPFTPNNRQQLLRKRHIGNDIVTIVFQEPGALPFTPKNIRSQFQHVFIVVRALNPCSENVQYSVAVSRSKEVPVFGPPIADGAIYPKSKAFADFLLAKVINAENAAHRSEKFATMATRTRQEYLKDLTANYSTTTTVDSGQKFSMLSFSSKKKERHKPPRFLPDAAQKGAISWQVLLDDSGQSTLVECFLAISTETFVLIEENSQEIVFVTPCKAILGWAAQANSLRIYYHQGECVTVQVCDGDADRDELMEIVARLRVVAGQRDGVIDNNGNPGSGSKGLHPLPAAQELPLRRNPLGQLGFHVQPDGVVTQVEPSGHAWSAGLRQGARLVEICKVAVSTLSHDQMVDLLKTSVLVTVTVIPPLPDGNPRRGCWLTDCKYTIGNYEGDYENLGGPDEVSGSSGKNNSKPATHQQAVPGNHRRRYERSLSPPRSSNSSGYGTGSSSKSFAAMDSRFPSNPEGTMTSSSSGHSSDDRWYELLEPAEVGQDAITTTGASGIILNSGPSSGIRTNGSPPPPPLPARLGSGGGSAFHQVAPKRRGPPTDEPSHSSSSSQSSTPNINSKMQGSVSNSHYHSNYAITPVNSSHGHSSMGSLSIYNDGGVMVGGLQPSASQEFKLGEVRPIPRMDRQLEYHSKSSKLSEYTPQNDFGALKSASLPPDCVHRGDLTRPLGLSDGHSTDTSSTSLAGARSEDELSAGSSNVSPRMRRANTKRSGTITPSSGSSRNQSPRPSGGSSGGGSIGRDTGEARLRPGVTGRSANRNSANLACSTLQEDLMRLINPDYLRSDRDSDTVGDLSQDGDSLRGSVVSSTGKVHSSSGLDVVGRLGGVGNRSRSRENLAIGSALSMLAPHHTTSQSHQDMSTENISIERKGANVSRGLSGPEPAGNGSSGADVIFTTARPATVISNASTASSPAPSENKMSKEERLSPRVIKTPSGTQKNLSAVSSGVIFSENSSSQGSSSVPALPPPPLIPALPAASLLPPLPLSDSRQMDWPSLVDTATRAMLIQATEGEDEEVKCRKSERKDVVRRDIDGEEDDNEDVEDSDNGVPEAARNGQRLGHWVDHVAERLGLDTGGNISSGGGRRVHELQTQLGQLESRVARETRRRLSLEEEVRHLREENRRLQEESAASAQQLRRFTDWFFQTIQHQ
ncbi:signal-induced proliferation-associated 1-like protein 3 [Ischnura elegans]|uniref:signal-induced proliferation-associated 1-like protein 3 n=1 Tax=Ischnura elegans TaxID=197161 RepID=UPI001ED8B814|nr:signal-induced proliferation-associated 1-like protein 3 [Ischnura elegans]